MAKNKNILKTILWIISILIALTILTMIILFATGVWELPSFPSLSGQQIILTDFPKGVSPQIIQQTPQDPSCTFNFDKSQALVGEDVTATIKDGELKRCVVAYNYENTGWKIYNVETLDIKGEFSATQSADVEGTYVFTALCGYFEGENFIIECRTNDATIEILPIVSPPPTPPPETEPPESGDVMGSGEANYILGVDGEASFEIQLTPGEFQVDLCAEIERRSSKVDSNCNPTGDLEDWNNFDFLDSYEVVWERSDQIVAGVSAGPNTYGNPDVVGVRWDGVNPFKGHLYHTGPCVMNMDMRVTIVVC
jgi:hypothetical protein